MFFVITFWRWLIQINSTLVVTGVNVFNLLQFFIEHPIYWSSFWHRLFLFWWIHQLNMSLSDHLFNQDITQCFWYFEASLLQFPACTGPTYILVKCQNVQRSTLSNAVLIIFSICTFLHWLPIKAQIYCRCSLIWALLFVWSFTNRSLIWALLFVWSFTNRSLIWALLFV